MLVSISYGKKQIKLSVPSKNVELIKKEEKVLKLDFNLGIFKENDYKNKKVLVVVPDKTRHAHLNKILPQLIKKLKISGASTIEIIIGLGLHHPLTKKEIDDLFGVVEGVEIINHDKNDVKYLGKTSLDIPIYLNRRLFDADKIITIGVVEPHLYAGFSGGPKAIAIGLAGEKTISATHNSVFLSKKGVGLLNISGNPFSNSLWEIAEKVSVDLAINLVNYDNGQLKKIFIGKTRGSFLKATDFCKESSVKKVRKPGDVVIAGIGFPKDINLYQASRAFNYILNVPKPIVKEGGKIVVFAQLSEGVGQGLGEKRFYNSLIAGLKNDKAGEHRTFMIELAKKKAELIIISENADKLKTNLPIKIFKKIPKDFIGKNNVIYVIEKSLSTIATL